MSIKTDRAAYTVGFTDGQRGNWSIDSRYPRNTQMQPVVVSLSDGTVVTGDPTPGWKPPFGKAVTPEDAELLADLWRNPTKVVPVEEP